MRAITICLLLGCLGVAANASELEGCWRVDQIDVYRRDGSVDHISSRCMKLIEGKNYFSSWCEGASLITAGEVISSGPGRFTYRRGRSYNERTGEAAPVGVVEPKVVEYRREGALLQTTSVIPQGRVVVHHSPVPASTCASFSDFLRRAEGATPPSTTPARQGSQTATGSTREVRLVMSRDNCVPGGGDGARLVVGIAPPDFDFSNPTRTRQTMEELLAQVPQFGRCNSRAAVLLASGASIDECFKGSSFQTYRFMPEILRGLEGPIPCVRPQASPHAYRSVNEKIEAYWNTSTGVAEKAARQREFEERAKAEVLARQQAEAKAQRVKEERQAEEDSRVPVAGSGPFTAAQIKKVCGRRIMEALITGGGMKTLHRVEYLPKIKAREISPMLPPSADAIPTALHITRYGEQSQVRLKLFLMKDSFGDWSCHRL